MSGISNLNSACVNKPIQSFKDLPIGEYYIINFQRVKTQFGKKIKIELADAVMFLPERIQLSNANLESLNESTTIMTYGGKDKTNKNRLILDFKPLEQELGDE